MRPCTALCALAFVALAGAARDSTFALPEEIRSFYDSLLHVPDSLLRIPGAPGAVSPQDLRAFARHLLYAPESLYAGPDSAHRTDAEMKGHFLKHERDFERLVRMFRADSTVHRVEAPEWRTPNPPMRLPDSRQREYERLLERVGVRVIEREARDRFLLRTTTAWTFDRRGYAWSPKPPRPVVERETIGCEDCYRRLKGPWYIYFRASS